MYVAHLLMNMQSPLISLENSIKLNHLHTKGAYMVT